MQINCVSSEFTKGKSGKKANKCIMVTIGNLFLFFFYLCKNINTMLVKHSSFGHSMNNCFLCVWICRHLPLSKVGIIIFINCWLILWIAGGESGVPFRLQVDSYSPNSSTDALPIHSAGCQVKVFKVSRWLGVLWTCTVWQQGLWSWQQWQWLPLWQWYHQQQQQQQQQSLLVHYFLLYCWYFLCIMVMWWCQ